MFKIGHSYGEPENMTRQLNGEICEVRIWNVIRLNPEKPDVPLNKNDAFQKVQKRHVQEKR